MVYIQRQLTFLHTTSRLNCAFFVTFPQRFSQPNMKAAPKARPDKEKVIDEVWTDARIKEFLLSSTPSQAGQAFAGEHDFFVLLKAYQAMRVEDFRKFLDYFREAGGNFQATNGRQQTLKMFIETHRKAAPFIAALEAVSSPNS